MNRPSAHSRLRKALTGLLVAVAVAVLVGGWPGAVSGMVLGSTAYLSLRRQPSRASVALARRIAADLPFAADLLAAALRAGASPDVAARSVGVALGGPLGERLDTVARALRLGTPPAEAWAYLGAVDGAHRVVEAAVRSQHSGSAFAGSLHRIAEDLRADLLVTADAAARRAAVLIVLPLGLCFLPAFVLAGLVPVIVAVLGDVLSR
jgi:pilus assembly protein TadC